MNIEIIISSRTNRAKAPISDGICVITSAKQHAWRYAVVLSHPRLSELLAQHQVDQLAQIAALDHVRACEAGAMGPPTAAPRRPATKHQFGYQSEQHAYVLVEAAISMIRETAAKLQWTVSVVDQTSGGAP